MEGIQIDPKEMLIFTGLNLLRTDFKSTLFWGCWIIVEVHKIVVYSSQPLIKVRIPYQYPSWEVSNQFRHMISITVLKMCRNYCNFTKITVFTDEHCFVSSIKYANVSYFFSPKTLVIKKGLVSECSICSGTVISSLLSSHNVFLIR